MNLVFLKDFASHVRGHSEPAAESQEDESTDEPFSAEVNQEPVQPVSRCVSK